jgi:cyclopropane fatty-acyl-phospholipid synthase-like methyltransferase
VADTVDGVAGARWTPENVWHGLALLRQGSNPAATVYDSIGPEFFLALAPGWLNLGLWEGDGSDPSEAPIAVRRLVERVAADLPVGGDVLDVGNGLGAQDPVIAAAAQPRRLVAVNITRSQLVAGRARLFEAGALPVNADATRLPIRAGAFDGVISVEAAFHFPSRERFFREAFRVLRPGGALTMSDVPTTRRPRTPAELLAGFTQLRVWGLHVGAAQTPAEIADRARRAGFVDVRTELVGDRVIGPALRFARERLDRGFDGSVPRSFEVASRLLLDQVALLWRRGVLEYLLLAARRPDDPRR